MFGEVYKVEWGDWLVVEKVFYEYFFKCYDWDRYVVKFEVECKIFVEF